MGDEGQASTSRRRWPRRCARDLVPLADIVAPNLWEFARLTGGGCAALARRGCRAHRARSGGRWLISSVPSPAGIGVVYVDNRVALLAETPLLPGKIPNGTGDMLTLRFAGGLVAGFGVEGALADAVGATQLVIAKTVQWQGLELSRCGRAAICSRSRRAPLCES